MCSFKAIKEQQNDFKALKLRMKTNYVYHRKGFCLLKSMTNKMYFLRMAYIIYFHFAIITRNKNTHKQSIDAILLLDSCKTEELTLL